MARNVVEQNEASPELRKQLKGSMNNRQGYRAQRWTKYHKFNNCSCQHQLAVPLRLRVWKKEATTEKV